MIHFHWQTIGFEGRSTVKTREMISKSVGELTK